MMVMDKVTVPLKKYLLADGDGISLVATTPNLMIILRVAELLGCRKAILFSDAIF